MAADAAAGAGGGMGGAGFGAGLAVAGAVSSAIGSYFNAKTQQYQLKSQASSLQFQSDLSRLNALQAEFTAQQVMRAGQMKAGAVGLRAGKIRSSQRASLAARGIDITSDSAVEQLATTEYMKDLDLLTVNAETVHQAEAARLQKQNYLTQASMQSLSSQNAYSSAGTISPFAAVGTSLIGGGAQVANAWYQDRILKSMQAGLPGGGGATLEPTVGAKPVLGSQGPTDSWQWSGGAE